MEYGESTYYKMGQIVAIRGPRCDKKAFLTPLNPHHGSWIHSDWTIFRLQQKLQFIRPHDIFPSFSFGEPVPTVASDSDFEAWNPMSSSASESDVLYIPTCFFLTMIVKSGYFSYRNLTVSLNQSGYWCLSSTSFNPQNCHWQNVECFLHNSM